MAMGGPGGETETLLSTTRYYSSLEGNVTRVATNPAGTNQYEAVWLHYASNGRTVTFVLGETWNWAVAGCPSSYDVTFAREFRYDSARQRYLNRELDPDTLDTVYELWSDYDGDEVYGHFDTDGMGTVNEVDSIELGLASISPWQSGGGSMTRYYHTDMLGTTRARSDSSGSGLSGPLYSAFGERIDGFEGYGYDGAWGYQATYIGEASNPSDAFPFLHVGHRYYDPAIGRFLQRDPIGIGGGSNVYAYVGSAPTTAVDPSGLVDQNWEPPWGIPPKVNPKPKPPPSLPPGLKDKLKALHSLCTDLKDIVDSIKDIISKLKNRPPLRIPGPIPPFFYTPPGLVPPPPGEKEWAMKYFDAHDEAKYYAQYVRRIFLSALGYNHVIVIGHTQPS